MRSAWAPGFLRYWNQDVSTIFDFALAYVTASFVKARRPGWARAAFVVVLFSLPFLMNSAV